MSSLLQDLRFAWRMMRKSPGFTAVAIFTLALGIGANTAIFTVTSALLLRPFPYLDPQQLMSVDVKADGSDRGVTLLRYELLRDHNQSFQGTAVYTNDNFNLTGHGEPVQVPVGRVSANFFSLLGVKPQLGRGFSEEEGRPEGKFVVMISDALWHTRFGGDRNVIGESIALDSTPHTIVGVLPPDAQFPFMGASDVWTPRYFELTLIPPQRLRMGVGYLSLIARLKPGVGRDRANAELAVLNQQYRKENPGAPDADPNVNMTASPLRDSVIANVRTGVLLLFGAVALLLLIACANVASLLLSRALARTREIAVRTALGASRTALFRQLLTETVVLALISGAAGLALGFAATRFLAGSDDANLPQGVPITMDARVLLFTIAISLLTGLIFGILPAIHLTRTNVNASLRDEGRGASASHSRVHFKNWLVVGQVALSLLLLIGAGLLVRSFTRLLDVDPGFEARNLLTMNVSLPTSKYSKPEQQIAFFDEMLRGVSSVPGVRSAAISAALPLTTKRITPVLPEGQADVPLPQRPFVDIEAVSPQWFHTMRVPLVSGRAFTDADNAEAPKVVIVNQSFARQYWPRENPVGKHVALGRWPKPAEVVGVTADVNNRGLAQSPAVQLYLPFPQLPWGNMNLLVRTAVAPQSVIPDVRARIASVDPDQPVTNIQTAEELMNISRAQPRFSMILLGVFSATALILAVIGIYGVLAYSVAQRRQELGIRLALGAERLSILRLVVGQGLRLALFGVAFGLIAAIVLTRLMAGVLYHVSAYDAATFIIAPIVFLAIALLASYLPARRATKVDPLEALRSN